MQTALCVKWQELAPGREFCTFLRHSAASKAPPPNAAYPPGAPVVPTGTPVFRLCIALCSEPMERSVSCRVHDVAGAILIVSAVVTSFTALSHQGTWRRFRRVQQALQNPEGAPWCLLCRSQSAHLRYCANGGCGRMTTAKATADQPAGGLVSDICN